jgi:hypothetical protein
MDNQVLQADVAELADAQASGACGLNARGGSTPLIRSKSNYSSVTNLFTLLYPNHSTI